jgi:hypothetical protein
MTYTILSRSLHPVAEATKKYFKNRKGINNFKIENPINSEFSFCPTLCCETNEGAYICVDVRGDTDSSNLDAVLLDCMRECLPVKMYIAYSAGIEDPHFKKNLEIAKKKGLGILEVDVDGKGTVHCEPLSLSLVGVRPVQLKAFPPKYRLALDQAESTFRSGDPVKGCSRVYDELEALTRRLAIISKNRSFWLNVPSAAELDTLPKKTTGWANILKTLIKHFDKTKANCPNISEVLLSRRLGSTSFRNESGHKLTKVAHVIRRDRALRTRFESSVDDLFEMVDACRPLHL